MAEKELTLKEMQQRLDEYIQQFKVGYFPPMEQMVRLSEEVGELAREVSHEFGQKKKKSVTEGSTVAEELGDVLVVVALLANSLKIDLTEVFEKNLEKFYRRDVNRFERKDESEHD